MRSDRNMINAVVTLTRVLRIEAEKSVTWMIIEAKKNSGWQYSEN